PALRSKPLRGTFSPEARSESSKDSSIPPDVQPTSPVEVISTPSMGSAPGMRPKLNMGHFTPCVVARRPSFMCDGLGNPIMARVARRARLIEAIFETNGNDLDARALHSITLTLPS